MTIYDLQPGDLVGSQYEAFEIHSPIHITKTRTFYYIQAIELTPEPILPLPKAPDRNDIINSLGFRQKEIPRDQFVFRNGIQIWPPMEEKMCCPHCGGDVFPCFFDEPRGPRGSCLSCHKMNR